MSQQAAVPTFRDIANMDDRELVRLMVKRQSCYRCGQSSTLEAITDSIREISNDPQKGLRQISLSCHCSSCGTLPGQLKITVPTNEEAYKAIFGFTQKMKNFRPSANAVAQAQKIRRRVIDPTKPWYSEKDG